MTNPNLPRILDIAQSAIDLTLACNEVESFAIASVAFSQAQGVARTALCEIFTGAPSLADESLNIVFAEGCTVVQAVTSVIRVTVVDLGLQLCDADETDVFAEARGERVDQAAIDSICSDITSYTRLLDEIEAIPAVTK